MIQLAQMKRLLWCKEALRDAIGDIDKLDVTAATRSVQEVLFELYAIQGRAVSLRVHKEGSPLIV